MLEKKEKQTHTHLHIVFFLGGCFKQILENQIQIAPTFYHFASPQNHLTGREAAAAAPGAVGRAVAEAGGGNADLRTCGVNGRGSNSSAVPCSNFSEMINECS